MEKRTIRQTRTCLTNFKTREDGEKLRIEGYFSVFNSNYELWPGATESVAPGAFSETLGVDDVRALIDHETMYVLGRNVAQTLELREDDYGLWGGIEINPNDQDAMNLYARVQRGDVNQCSFGFDILEEETDFRDDGSIHWTIKKVKLYEVSICTFPAYKETEVEARKKDFEQIRQRKVEAGKEKLLKRLKKGKEDA